MKNDELIKMGEKGIKHPRPSGRPDRTAQVTPEDNKRFITNSLRVAKLPKIDTNDPVQVADRVEEYFIISGDGGVKPSYAGLALALGINRASLYNWVNGVVNKPKEVVEIIKRAVTILNMQMEDYMQNGQINPVSGIFLMKNNLGYKDQAEMILTPNNPLGELDQKGLEERYLESIPEVAESESDSK